MKFFVQIKDYIVESIHEVKKVTWPTKKHTINYSIIVVALSLGTAVFFGILDFIFKAILQGVIA